ncbi:SFT2 domain containing 2a isoform X3 [Neoarius graeffei]|uniref:SFT2 domain containing 2a isoform X3 n=1 Tax=Neoarius graeffei TaxID=443677 RepID=UPI00298C8AB9|nr:SFT2 domain containing 2a isoform X3 [Neoarius graeffei]
MDKLRAVLNGRDGNPDSTPNVIQTVNEASTLSWTTRVRGFGGVCCLFIPRIGIILFIVLYTFGNICSLASTMFLMGPVKQLKRMFDKTRAFATVVMLACLVLTLCAAFWVRTVVHPICKRCHTEVLFHDVQNVHKMYKKLYLIQDLWFLKLIDYHTPALGDMLCSLW